MAQLAGWFAERSARGILTRMLGAWLLVGLPVIAASTWWSAPAAIGVFAVTLTVYVGGDGASSPPLPPPTVTRAVGAG